MTRQAIVSGDALAPLTTALLERARRAADEVLASADEDVRAVLGRARAQADALLAEARAKGAADGAAVLAAERAGAQRRARSVLLAAQAAAHEDLRAAARGAVCALREDPDYPAMIEALRARAMRDLGPGTSMTELDGGGIVAESGQRRVEYSLAALADDLVDQVVAIADPWSG